MAVNLLPVATCASIAVLGMMSAPASAIQTVVGGKTYDVSTFFGSYNSNSSRFTTAEMPWFGSQGLARDFAAAVGNQLGVGALGQGPLFAYSTFSFLGTVAATINAVTAFGLTISPVPILAGFGNNYAVAREVPVPGPLPLMGAGVAFGFSRRLRSRIKRSTTI